ncbi:NAD-dependent DNA ligase LigA [soil metagenome]
MYTKEDIKQLQQSTTQFATGEAIEIERLRQVLRFHEYRYYTLNDPLISDKEYDLLYKKLEKAESENPFLITPDSPTQRVGSGLNKEFVAVSHLVPMLSLENSYNEDDLKEWDKRIKKLLNTQQITYTGEPKYDGASISLIYTNDFLVRGATRGDGVMGDEITTNIRQIRSVPLSASFSKYGVQKIEIRGEVLMTKKNFKKYNDSLAEQGLPPLANPRNAAAGSLRMKDPNEVKRRALEAILYHVSFVETGAVNDDPLSTHAGALKMLSEIGFHAPIAESKVLNNIDEVIEYCNSFEAKRDELPYEVDGVVIKINDINLQQRAGATTHHPRWAMAFKFKARQATSKLLSVEFQVGRTGSITPVAKIQPVPIGGVTVGSVSLFNEDVIAEKDLMIGDTVLVERAGDVIPYIVKPLTELRTGKEEKIVFPKECPACGDTLVKPAGEAVTRCVNINCKAQVVERMIHFVSKDAMDIKSFGEANVRKFFDLELLRSIPEIYSLDFSKIAELEGFGKKSLDNLREAIERSKTQPLQRLIFGLGIRYVGETTAKTLAKNVHHILDFENLSVGQLQNFEDVGVKVAAGIHQFFHLDDNIRMIKDLEAAGIKMINEHPTEQPSGKLSGKTFLFTGTLPTLKRNDAESMAEQNGGKLLSGVSAKLDYLIVGEDAGSKLEKAKKLGTVKIISEQEFLQLL